MSFLLRESVPHHWLHLKKVPSTINISSTVWLLATLVLSFGYSGTLLSSLMTTDYEQPIDSINDLINNEKKLLVPTKTMIHASLLTDPRSSVQTIVKNLLVTKPYEPFAKDRAWQEE